MAKILLVEDDTDIAEIIIRTLTLKGNEVLLAVDGVDAVEHLAETHYDLVISDLFMPRKDGIEVVREVRRAQPGVPVVLITGGTDFFPSGGKILKTLTDTAEILGAIRTLHKPFRPSELISTVNAVLAGDNHIDVHGLD